MAQLLCRAVARVVRTTTLQYLARAFIPCRPVASLSLQATPAQRLLTHSTSTTPTHRFIHQMTYGAPRLHPAPHRAHLVVVPVRRMATLKERVAQRTDHLFVLNVLMAAVRETYREDREYYNTMLWGLGSFSVVILYLWKEYLAGGSGTVMDVTEMTFSQRLDERRHGFLMLMNLAADPAYRLNVANGPGTLAQLARAVTRAKDGASASVTHLCRLILLCRHHRRLRTRHHCVPRRP